MIPVRIEEIDRAALDALIDNAVPEGKTIEYKQELPGKADGDIARLIAAVTSFANTDGGISSSASRPTKECLKTCQESRSRTWMGRNYGWHTCC